MCIDCFEKFHTPVRRFDELKKSFFTGSSNSGVRSHIRSTIYGAIVVIQIGTCDLILF